MTKSVTIIGAGPSGLIAAQKLAETGYNVTIYERKKSPARKFLLAGRGGLNLTHSEPLSIFATRYRQAEAFMSPILSLFSPDELRSWCCELGEETFIGSSGRIFPKTFKASPLLRALLKRLERLGVLIKTEKDWIGWQGDDLVFQNPDLSTEIVHSDATLLALGGASWPHLGADGSWKGLLIEKDIEVFPFRPANCGFHVAWSDLFKAKFAGKALKTIAVIFSDRYVPGEIMIDKNGIEGGAVYALSAEIRDALEKEISVDLHIDLKPGLSSQEIIKKFHNRPRGRLSFSSYLEKAIGLNSLSIHLLREADTNVTSYSPDRLADLIKSVPISLSAAFEIDRAISTAGGISLSELNSDLMLNKMSGVFVAGEMLGWEAPTGGYLLQGCFSSGMAAAIGITNYLRLNDV